MARKRALPKFSGPLSEPIIVDISRPAPILGLTKEPDEKSEDQVARWAVLERYGKLGLLLRHYEIDPKDEHRWFHLSYWLACDFVRGMQLQFAPLAKRGRPSTWKSGLGSHLFSAVEQVKLERGKGLRDAIRILQKRERNRWGGYKASNLETRYREEVRTRKRFAEMMARLSPYANQQSSEMGGLLGISLKAPLGLANPIPPADEK
jgi:hypothetical protein